MDPDLHAVESQPLWVEAADHLEPIALPEPPRAPEHRDARRALVLAIVGVVCLGFVFGPLALALGQRARMALLAAPDGGGAGEAHAAIALGKIGLALHLTIAASVVPWLLFVLPLLTPR